MVYVINTCVYLPSSKNSSYILFIYHCITSYNIFQHEHNVYTVLFDHILIVHQEINWHICRIVGDIEVRFYFLYGILAALAHRNRDHAKRMWSGKKNASVNKMRGSTTRKIRNHFQLAIISRFTVITKSNRRSYSYLKSFSLLSLWLDQIIDSLCGNCMICGSTQCGQWSVKECVEGKWMINYTL